MHEAIASHLGSRQVSRVLYGSIIGLALVLTLEAHEPGDGTIVGTLLATAVAVGLAELYSEIVGTEARTRKRVRRTELGEIGSEVVATAVGVAFPAIFFLLAGLGVMETGTAFQIAKWSGLGLITAYGFAAARLTGSTLVQSLVRAALAAVIAAFLIVVKALVH